MFNKRGQQSSVGMSFGMIFSIFLIIVFVFTAVTVIYVFLDFSGSADVGKFYTTFQDEIDGAWRSSYKSDKFKISLDSAITHVCFMNVTADINANQNLVKDLEINYYQKPNVFLIPPGEAGALDSKHIEHLDIAEITKRDNPYCVVNPSTLNIEKGLRSRLVVVS